MSKLSERKQIQAAIARREKLAVTSSNAIVTECLVCELFDSNEICTHRYVHITKPQKKNTY
jgi:hypothetical protein